MAFNFGSFAGGLASGYSLTSGLAKNFSDASNERELSKESDALSKKMEDSTKYTANEGGGLSKAMPDAQTATNYADYNNKIAAEDEATFGTGALSSAPVTKIDKNQTYSRADYYSDMGRKASGLGMAARAESYQNRSEDIRDKEFNRARLTASDQRAAESHTQNMEKGQIDLDQAKTQQESVRRVDAFTQSVAAAREEAVKNGGTLAWGQIETMARGSGLKPAASTLTGLDDAGTKYTAGMRVAQFDKAYHTTGLDGVAKLYNENPLFDNGMQMAVQRGKDGSVTLMNGKTPMFKGTEPEAAVFMRSHLTDPINAVKFQMEVLQNHAKLRESDSKVRENDAQATSALASAANSRASAAKTGEETRVIRSGGGALKPDGFATGAQQDEGSPVPNEADYRAAVQDAFRKAPPRNPVPQPETRIQQIKQEVEARKEALRSKIGAPAEPVQQPGEIPAAADEINQDQLLTDLGGQDERAPTVDVMQKAVAMVGEDEFKSRVDEHINAIEQDEGEPLPPAERAAEVEGVARLITSGAYGDTAPDGNIDSAAHAAATSPQNDVPQPTEAQKQAGNYKKGKIKLNGLDISIENPAGSKRSGVDSNGQSWEVEMRDHYGYIKGTVGNDKDHIDTFIVGQNPERSDTVYIVDQVDPKTGKFDEHKVIMGMGPGEADFAKARYLNNYAQGWKGAAAITEMSLDEFKAWLKSGDTTQPIANGKATAKPQAVRELSIGTTPSNAEPITVKNGAIHIGKYPAQHFETGEDITVQDGADGATIAKALRDAGAVGGRQKIFGAPKPAKPTAVQQIKKQVAAKKAKDALTPDEFGSRARKAFIRAIKDAGGITVAEARDVSGEPAHIANRMAPGLFRKDGNALDLVARRLNELGYLNDAGFGTGLALVDDRQAGEA